MSFSLNTILEIALLSVVYYGFIRHLHQTRGGGLLAGFIILLLLAVGGVALLIRSFKLPHIEWIADAALPALSIALLIIFQPELRLAISRIGSARIFRWTRRFFGSRGSVTTDPVVDALTNACERLAKQSHGALIVVERREGIVGFAQGGSKIDGKVTSRLLESIFYPGTALHDGAAFVIKGRLSYAGCKLDVSTSNAQVRQHRLGTRHSAALGISEESDALVIVVSEERGAISVAKQGRLKLDIKPAELREILSKGMDDHRDGGLDPAATPELSAKLDDVLPLASDEVEPKPRSGEEMTS